MYALILTIYLVSRADVEVSTVNAGNYATEQECTDAAKEFQKPFAKYQSLATIQGNVLDISYSCLKGAK